MYDLELQNKILEGTAKHYAEDNYISWTKFGFESGGDLKLWTNLKILENHGLIEVMHLGNKNNPTACNPIQLTKSGWNRVNTLQHNNLQKTSTFLPILILTILVSILGAVVIGILG